MSVYHFNTFSLHYNPETGEAITRYVDGCWTGCKPVPDDKFHGDILGITDKAHRLEHEIFHHIVGLYYYQLPTGSPVLWKDAHHLPQDESSSIEEWLVTTLTYWMHAKQWEHRDNGIKHLMKHKFNVDEHIKEAKNIIKLLCRQT